VIKVVDVERRIDWFRARTADECKRVVGAAAPRVVAADAGLEEVVRERRCRH